MSMDEIIINNLCIERNDLLEENHRLKYRIKQLELLNDKLCETNLKVANERDDLNVRIKQRDEWNEKLDEIIDRKTERIILLNEIRHEAGVQDANLRKKLSEANERIKRLEKAGDELEYASVISEAGEDPNGFEKLLIAQRKWNKSKEAKP
jgi:chromosome segregation ATPase